MRPWSYLILLILPALVVAGNLIGGWWNFLVPLFCFAAYPFANIFLSSSEEHAHSSYEKNSRAYSSVALSFVPVLLALTIWCLFETEKENANLISVAGLGVSLGIVNGILGFTLAHEFIHRFNKTSQVAGNLLLLMSNYMHYGIEHVWGHHVYACTPEDPHTARVGETLYAYLPKAIFFTYRNAARIERKRLARSSYKIKLLHDRMLWYALMQCGLMAFIFFALGLSALLFFLFQNLVAILLLHTINYLQHYGLMRKANSPGNYEKLDAHHAWNTGRSNKAIDLFHLENHADHHMHPNLPFEQLTKKQGSPEHPAGYSFMLLLSLIPPLWFKIMNKRIPLNMLNDQS